MKKQDLLNKIFTEHLLAMLSVYNQTGDKLAKLEEKSQDRAINK